MKTVRNATPTEEAAAIATLTLAFSIDPATRWTWPDPQAYLNAFPRFAKAFGGAGFSQGGAHIIGDHAGTALWLPTCSWIGCIPMSQNLLSGNN